MVIFILEKKSPPLGVQMSVRFARVNAAETDIIRFLKADRKGNTPNGVTIKRKEDESAPASLKKQARKAIQDLNLR